MRWMRVYQYCLHWTEKMQFVKIIDAIESHQRAIELVTYTSTVLALLQIKAQLYINFYGFDLHDFIFF